MMSNKARISKKVLLGVSAGLAALLLGACASPPAATQTAAKPAAAPAAAAAPATGSSVTEKDTASLLERRFQEAARSYKIVERDGKTLYCKREKQLGSTIPTMNCMTESQLRTQVETMEEYKSRARSNGRCTTGVGCGAGS